MTWSCSRRGQSAGPIEEVSWRQACCHSRGVRFLSHGAYDEALPERLQEICGLVHSYVGHSVQGDVFQSTEECAWQSFLTNSLLQKRSWPSSTHVGGKRTQTGGMRAAECRDGPSNV